MIITGKYNEARVFTDVIDEAALKQVQEMCDTDFLEGNKIRMMPDVHAGKGSTIGTTMTIRDKIVPNYTGGRYRVWSTYSKIKRYRTGLYRVR